VQVLRLLPAGGGPGGGEGEADRALEGLPGTLASQRERPRPVGLRAGPFAAVRCSPHPVPGISGPGTAPTGPQARGGLTYVGLAGEVDRSLLATRYVLGSGSTVPGCGGGRGGTGRPGGIRTRTPVRARRPVRRCMCLPAPGQMRRARARTPRALHQRFPSHVHCSGLYAPARASARRTPNTHRRPGYWMGGGTGAA
jgi:hypothetical protein